MEPDGVGIEWLTTGLALAAAIGLGFVWSLARGWWRIPVRSMSVLACLSLTAVAGLSFANRLSDVYPTWSSLFGSDKAVNLPSDDLAASTGGTGSGSDEVKETTGGGTIVNFTEPGAHSGMNLPIYAYLPAGYSTDTTTRYPVIEALDGFPGSPLGWLRTLNVVKILDTETAAHRMAPTVVLFPYQTPKPTLDTECTNLVGGPQAETYLTEDVPAIAAKRLRIRTDPAAWGLIGYSAGGYCAADLLLRHPTEYTAGASLSGYVTPGIKIGNGTEHTTYNLVWRLHHYPVPAVSLYVTCARDDADALFNAGMLVKNARAPLAVTTAYIAGGGHNGQTWQAMEAPGLDWLSDRLARPTTTSATAAAAGAAKAPAKAPAAAKTPAKGTKSTKPGVKASHTPASILTPAAGATTTPAAPAGTHRP